jgi:hypothetical protein
MFVVGALMLLGGGVCLAMPLLPDEFWSQNIQQLRAQGQDPFPPNTPLPEIRRYIIRQFLVMGLIAVALGLAETILGLFVYRGRRRAAVAAAALGVVLLGGMGLTLLISLIATVTAGPSALGMFFMLLLPGALVAVQCIRLIEALRVREPRPEHQRRPAQPTGAQPPPLPLAAQLPPGEAPILDYNFAAGQRLPPPPAGPAR